MSELKSEINKFLATFSTALTSFCIIYPFIRHLGFPSAEAFEQLDPFIRECCSGRSNSFFLYVLGCFTVTATGILYYGLALKKIERYSFALVSEALISFIGLLLAWHISSKETAVVILLLRWGTSQGSYQFLKNNRMTPPAKTAGLLEALLYFLAILTISWFLKTKVLFSIFSDLKVDSIIKLMGFSVTAYLLLLYEHRLHRNIRYLLDGTVVVLIFILTFRSDMDYFFYSDFLGPANDVALGKDILKNVVSIYGFLDIYFLAMIFNIFKVSDFYAALSLIASVCYAAGYGLLYLFFRMYTGKIGLSSLFLLLMLLINFYYSHVPVHWMPNVGFFRFGAFLPVFFYLFCRDRIRNKKLGDWILAFFVAMSFFWVIESGSWVILSLMAVCLCQYFFCKDPQLRKSLIPLVVKTFVFLALIVLILIIRIQWKYGTWPVWSDLIYFHKFHLGSGAGASQLSNFSLWPLPAVIYFVTIYVCLRAYSRIRFADAWLFLAFLGLQWLLYYILEVLLYQLARCVLPAMMLFFVSLSYLVSKDIALNFKFRVKINYLIYVLVIFLCVLAGFSIDKHNSHKTFFELLRDNPGEFIKNTKTDSIAKFFPRNKILEIKYDLLGIQKLIKPGQAAVIISKHDTLYYIQAKRKSFFKIAFYPAFNFTINDVPDSVERILKSDTEYLFIDNSLYQCFNNTVSPHVERMRTLLSGEFRKKDSLGLLDVYERIK